MDEGDRRLGDKGNELLLPQTMAVVRRLSLCKNLYSVLFINDVKVGSEYILFQWHLYPDHSVMIRLPQEED